MQCLPYDRASSVQMPHTGSSSMGHEFLEDTNNEEECKKALEHWDSRNRGMLRDPKTNKVCEQSAFQVLRTYADRYGHSLEAIDNGLDWAYFEDENGFDPQACMNAFGLQWPHHSEQHSE
jgi:hypothetical protein